MIKPLSDRVLIKMKEKEGIYGYGNSKWNV